MPSDAIRAHPVLPASERANDDDLVHIRFGLMRDLEASLEGSRKALLVLDLAGIEHGNSEQMRLLCEMAATLPRRGAAQDDGCSRFAGGAAEHRLTQEHERERERGKELCQSRDRILTATRLQGALLSRARTKLRVLANMLASPSADYGPLLSASRSGFPVSRTAPGRESD
jgi:hypothetical protein